MSSGGPDLFVICKSCGSEVSPYITECPYCGNRLRKRAPKLPRDGEPEARARRRPSVPSLGRLRPGEIPGIRADRHPYATLTVVVLSFITFVLWRSGAVPLSDLGIFGKPGAQWWRVLTAPLTYENTGYAFAALLAIAIFGWLLERRHGPLAIGALVALGGAGGMALAALAGSSPIAFGGNGAALALLTAWAIPDLLDHRAGHEVDGDLLGVAVFAVVLLLMPVVADDANVVAGFAGVAAGLAAGLPLARLSRAR